MLKQSNAANHFIPTIIGASPRHTRSCPALVSTHRQTTGSRRSIRRPGYRAKLGVSYQVFRDNFEMRAVPPLYMLMTPHLRARITAGVRTTP
jgi:hypothetical protein